MDSQMSGSISQRTVPIRRGKDASAAQARPVAVAPQPPIDNVAQITPPLEAVPEAHCPKCQSKLINPETLGWCAKCGYCRSLEKDVPAAGAWETSTGAKKSSFIGIVEFCELVKGLPGWTWVLTGGMALLVAASFAADKLLPTECLARAIWGTSQVALSIAVILAANAWALFLLAPDDPQLSGKDIAIFGRLWKLILDRMPETKKQAYLCSWASTALICGCFVIGGFDYWFQLYQPKKLAKAELVTAASALAKKDDDKNLQDSVKDLAEAQNIAGQGAAKDTPKTFAIQTVIVGFILDEKNRLDGLAVAAMAGTELKYAGMVRRGFRVDNVRELQKRLSPIVVDQPPIPGLSLRGVTWVKPEVFCEVATKGFDDSQRLKDAELKALLASNEK